MNFFNTYISEKSIEYAVNALRSTFISEGKLVEEFEKKLTEKLGLLNPVALNSGTSALHLALILAGVKSGDEVIIPPQTFIATGMAVLYQNAVPVFADIQLGTGNISPVSIKEKITKKTKALIAVHWAGYPCDMDEINEIAKENKISVIEDAAHALGAEYKGKVIGTISQFTCFSFQAIKHLTTGDGGALCCMNDAEYDLAKRIRWFDIDRRNTKANMLGEREYDAEHIGYKYHMNDLAAAVGLGNLDDFPENLNKLRYIAKRYREELKNIKGISLLENKNDRLSSHWIFTMLIENRNDFVKAMTLRKIPVSVVHQRIDKNKIFGGTRNDLFNMDKFNEQQIAIPIHAGLSEDNIEKIISEIRKGW